MSWDHVRIEPSAAAPDCAELFLMNEHGRAYDIAIAHLPISGTPSRMTVMDSADWRFILDVLAEVNCRHTSDKDHPWVPVETSDGAVWMYFAEPGPTP
jgi:hypothetical protein